MPRHITPFFNRVYDIVSTIPAGKVLTYKDVAIHAGSPHAARAVGMAMKNNPNAPVVPCHRVVGADGSLIGYSAGSGTSTKEQLLRSEGVHFNGHKVDLHKSRWNTLLHKDGSHNQEPLGK